MIRIACQIGYLTQDAAPDARPTLRAGQGNKGDNNVGVNNSGNRNLGYNLKGTAKQTAVLASAGGQVELADGAARASPANCPTINTTPAPQLSPSPPPPVRKAPSPPPPDRKKPAPPPPGQQRVATPPQKRVAAASCPVIERCPACKRVVCPPCPSIPPPPPPPRNKWRPPPPQPPSPQCCACSGPGAGYARYGYTPPSAPPSPCPACPLTCPPPSSGGGSVNYYNAPPIPPGPPPMPPGTCDNGLPALPPAPPAPAGAPPQPDACSVSRAWGHLAAGTAPPAAGGPSHAPLPPPLPTPQIWNNAQQAWLTMQCPSPCDTCIEDCTPAEPFCIPINNQDLPRFTSLASCQADVKCQSACMQCNTTHWGCYTYGGGG